MEDVPGRSWEERFSTKVDRLVLFLEKDRLSFLGIFFYVLLLSIVRDLSEYYLLDRVFVIDPHPWIFSMAHHIAFYFLVFMGLVLLLSAFTKRGTRKSMNFVCSFYWIILLPPYIDHYVFGWRENYSYLSPTEFLNALIHFSGSTFHYGQGLEVAVVLFALFAYAIWTQRARLLTVSDRFLTILRVSLLVLFAFLSLFFLATPGAYLPVGSAGGFPVFPSFDAVRYHQYHLFIFAYYLIIGIFLLFSVVYITRREIFVRLISSMRPAQTLFFLGIVVAGVATGWSVAGGTFYITSILATPYWVNLEFVVIALIAAFLTWQVSAMWNDLGDRWSDSSARSDRVLAAGLIDSRTFRESSLILAAVAVMISVLLSLEQAIILIMIFALSFIYSLRPFRLKEHVLSPLFIGLGTFLTFLFGYMTPFSIVSYRASDDLYFLTGEVFVPGLSFTAVSVGMFMFIGLVVGSMVTDVDGYAEDLEGKVKTIYTKLGLKRGVQAVAGLIFLASLTPLALFREGVDLLLFPLMGVAAAVLFWRGKRSRPVLIVALFGFVYAALRFLTIF